MTAREQLCQNLNSGKRRANGLNSSLFLVGKPPSKSDSSGSNYINERRERESE